MAKPIIQVNGLSKRYRLGKAERYRSLRESLSGAVRGPWDRLRRRADKSPAEEMFWALRDVSFEVQPGEVVGIIGRNGAGKSTLLKVLSRITDPTEGRIEIHGRVGSLLEVGTGFHPELTGRENVYMNGAILGMRRADIRRKFDEIVAFAEVEKFIDTPVKHYSSGMYMRLAFAVAAHLEPEILVIDEVLAVGDAQFQRKCLGKMRSLGAGGRTILFVSHNITAISTLCSTAAVLENGRLAFFGAVARGVEHYLSRDVRMAMSEWEGDVGDDTVRVLRSSVSQKSSATDVFLTDEPLRVSVEIALLKPVYGLIVQARVCASDSRLLVVSNYDDVGALGVAHHEPGTMRFELEIPANMLACGAYSIEFFVGIHNVKSIAENAAPLAIQLVNVSGIGRNFLTGGIHESVLRPEWTWRLSAATEPHPTCDSPHSS